jgi:hypothetical protein
MPMPRVRGGRSVMSVWPIRTRPAADRTNPATARSAVVLPEPDAPISAMISPGATSSVSLCRTVTPL